jgi:hypothetical protein
MEKFNISDRVYARPYDKWGTVVKTTYDKLPWNGERSIHYWVKLDNCELKPRGFSENSLISEDEFQHT